MSLLLQLSGFFTSTQSPITSDFFDQTFPLQYFNIAKHRNHLSNGANITQLVENLRIQEKVCHCNRFLSCDGSRDFICIFLINKSALNVYLTNFHAATTK